MWWDYIRLTFEQSVVGQGEDHRALSFPSGLYKILNYSERIRVIFLCCVLTAKLYTYQIPKNGPKLMVTQRELVKLIGSQKKAKTYEREKDICREEVD